MYHIFSCDQTFSTSSKEQLNFKSVSSEKSLWWLAAMPTHTSASLSASSPLRQLSWACVTPLLPFMTSHFAWDLLIFQLNSFCEVKDGLHFRKSWKLFLNGSKTTAVFDKWDACSAFSFHLLQNEGSWSALLCYYVSWENSSFTEMVEDLQQSTPTSVRHNLI